MAGQHGADRRRNHHLPPAVRQHGRLRVCQASLSGQRCPVLAGAVHADRAGASDVDSGLLLTQRPEPAGLVPGRDLAGLCRRLRRVPDEAVHPDAAQ